MCEPPLEIVGEIHEVADQILHLRRSIPDAFQRVYVRLPGQKLRRTRLRFVRLTVEGIVAEPLPLARFDKLTHRELPALLRAGT